MKGVDGRLGLSMGLELHKGTAYGFKRNEERVSAPPPKGPSSAPPIIAQESVWEGQEDQRAPSGN